MAGGHVVQDASPEELYHRPATKQIGMFVGDAQFIPGEASGRRVACELGDLPIHGTAAGRVDVMIRPEALRLTPATETTAPNATVLARRFFGHDQVMTVALDSGCTLHPRSDDSGTERTVSDTKYIVSTASSRSPLVVK
jgi:iron(III) transport system ATP-binding protein